MAKSWLQIPRDSPFSLANIPFGIISTAQSPTPRPAVAIGEYALDLLVFSSAGGFSELPSFKPHAQVFSQPTLNDFAALGRCVHRQVREYLQEIFRDSTAHHAVLKTNDKLRREALVSLKDVINHLPMQIGDYTDFYAGMYHAIHVGSLFRGPDNALQPNYKHMPVGYHGRASSIIVSGQPIRRPNGQILLDPAATPKVPVFSPSRRLDLEIELAAFVCKGNKLGDPIPIGEAEEHLFGVVLMNDWSARDIQAWEYIPLGPIDSKNFATSITPWVVLMDALEPFRVPGLEAQENLSLLSYLREKKGKSGYDIRLEFDLKTENGSVTTTVSKTNSQYLLYSFPQMLAHHSITGCNMRVGDLLGSGTISGKEPGTLGCLLEATKGGKEPVKLSDGSERLFLQDGDEVILRGTCGEEGSYVGFGDCVGTIIPAHVFNH